MDGMTHFVYLTLLVCSVLVFIFCIRRSSKLAYDEGRKQGVKDCADKINALTHELERFRDELLRRDAHTFVNSI